MKPKALLLLLGVTVLLLVPARLATAADYVQLRTGELFSGKILKLGDREVAIRLDSGAILMFRVSRVRKVKRWLPDRTFPLIIDYDQREAEKSDKPELEPVATDPPPDPFDQSTTIPGDTGNASDTSNLEPVQPSDLSGSVEPVQPVEPVDGGTHVDPVVVDAADIAPADDVADSDVDTTHSGGVSQRSTHRWTLEAPQGFRRRTDPQPSDVLQSWIEPVTQAVVTLAVYHHDGSLEDFKQALAQGRSSSKRPRVYRDVPLRWSGEGGFPGWILELEEQTAGSSLRQVSLLADGGDATFVLRCTAPSRAYRHLTQAFEESLHSFRLFPTDATQDAAPGSGATTR